MTDEAELEAKQKAIGAAALHILQALSAYGRETQLTGVEAAGALLLALGRFCGRFGYRGVATAEQAWRFICNDDNAKAPFFFRDGFESERRRES